MLPSTGTCSETGTGHGAAGFFLAVEPGSLEVAGIGESVADARLDAGRHARAKAQARVTAAALEYREQPSEKRTALTAPLDESTRRWADDLLVFQLVDGQP